jgi:hypothetical protein
VHDVAPRDETLPAGQITSAVAPTPATK